VHRLRDFWNGYIRVLKGPDLEEIADLWFFRPLAYLGVRLVAPTGMTPNQVTLASLLVAVLGGCLIGLADEKPILLIWGAAAVAFSNVLDCMDGMLARLRGTSSPFGGILDGLGDYAGVIAIMLGIGHFLSSRHGEQVEWWTLTLAATVTMAWWCAVVDGMRIEWMRVVYGQRRERAVELAALTDEAAEWKRQGIHRVNRLLVACYVFYVRLWGLDSEAAGGAVVVREPPVGPWTALNRPILRLALLGGPTMQLTAIIIAAACDRLEWFLWGTLFVGNAWAVTVLLIRLGVRRRLAAGAFEEA
jgi:phosphatidylglycerophosphate synthase